MKNNIQKLEDSAKTFDRLATAIDDPTIASIAKEAKQIADRNASKLKELSSRG